MKWSKFRKKLLKVIGHLIVDVVIVILLAFALFYFFEDEIKSELLAMVNQNQNGEIEIAEIDLSLFKYFPLISLQLSDVDYYENKTWQNSDSSSVICRAKRIYVSVNVVDLFHGKINVGKLTIEEAHLNIIINPDSTINFINALGIESSEDDKTTSDIILENVTINNMRINYSNEVGHHKASLTILNLTNQFTFSQNLIDCQLQFSGHLEMLFLDDRIQLNDQDILADIDFTINTDSITGEIQDSKLQVESLILKVNGNYGLDHDYLADLNLELSNENIELFSKLFSDKFIQHHADLITKGAIYGNGSLKWKSMDSLPNIDFEFGIDDLSLSLPEDTTLSVYFDFDGKFSTGQSSDLSEIKLELSDISARLPGGDVSGSFFLGDWHHPNFELKLNADLDVAGYENIFNISDVDSLKGVIQVITDLKGSYNKTSNKLTYDRGKASVQLVDLSFILSDYQQKVQKLNGKITQITDNFRIEDLSILSTFGDIKISGEFEDFISGFFKDSHNLTGNLKATSHRLDFGKVFSPDNSVIKVIGSKANNIEIDLEINLGSDHQLDNPQAVLDIIKFEAGLSEYPDIKSLTGRIEVQNDSLNFKNLQVKTDSGDLIFNGEILYDQSPFISLNSSIYLTNFYINKFASKNPAAEIIRLDVAGKFDGQLSISYGKEFDFLNLKDFTIDRGKLYYLNKTGADTVEINGLKAELKSAAINVSDGDKILSTLDVSGSYTSSRLKVNNFRFSNLNTEILGKSGKINLSENSMDLFGIYGNLILDADFTADDFRYRIDHKAKGQNIDHILDSVTENDLIDGLMDISFWIQMSGNTWQKNLQSMQGQFHNRGKNLLVKRVDIDELIQRFEKTQNFNLLDVGAFVFAGPAGAAFTKSVDYANLLKRNSGDSTLINDFIAEIEIEEGIASVEDMAFSTQKNRIIFGGKIDLINQSFTDFIIAIVDDNGCIIISKKLNGPFDKPVLEKFSAISTVLAPVTNAYNSIVGKECTPFYTGEITHPH